MEEIKVIAPTLCVGCPNPLPDGAAPQRRYCSASCRERSKAKRLRGASPRASGRPFRRPLPDVVKDAGWGLRKDVERLQRIAADDRFITNKQQVAAQLRGHLEFAAEVCQDLLSRLNETGV